MQLKKIITVVKLFVKNMKKYTVRIKKQNSSKHRRNRRAAFVPTEKDNTERLKYIFKLSSGRYINVKFTALKNTCRKITQMIQLKLNKFDFSAAGSAVSLWLINAFIEGVIVNFSVWGLLGWRFNIITIMAWGIAVKKSLDLYWRIKINGTDTKLPEKY